MKKQLHLTYFLIIPFVLFGCSNPSTEEKATVPSPESSLETTIISEEKESSEAVEVDSASSSHSTDEVESSLPSETYTTLNDYSNEEIEYARIWLQLGANQELDQLYAKKIPAGTPLNPDDETSAVYPEEVIQLTGTRLVDGSITYSSNRDGTINLYTVPLRWDGVYPAGEEFYRDLLDQTKQVSIEPNVEEDIIELIQLLTIE
ncbi:hypothetical protein QNK01_06075 [Desemzia incerta]|uniref:hypothetical protein n=1 Tax=Desemzia incerta TaxID=82801 RepID=UPI0024C38E3E|nr:hypothetical protein [Desemzia incerta]WHZ31081.1 hypothetical protein QNK01_06075 [Desemzia incerta]